jgi:4-methylaminobutanoate oxidase (formaldehyde-forming)
MVEADQPITTAYLDSGRWTVDIAGCEFPAITSMRPLYDPSNARIRA